MSLAPGVVIAERFELVHRLGQGSMGTVWAAKHRLTYKPVALKFLKDVEDKTMVQRFVREARAASAIRHPNVLQVHDVLQLDDGLALVMDLLDGESLECRLQRGGPLPLAELLRVMVKVLSAVTVIHGAGIVHRDLKPDNIFLARQSDGSIEPVLLDFGVCKLRRSGAFLGDSSKLTKAGELIGTPSYMAPEQITTSTEVDARVDVWALGVILYECASGTLPFRGGSLPAIVSDILNKEATPLSRVAPELPPELSKLVERMLTRDRAKRPADLRDALQVLHGLNGRSVEPTSDSPAITVRRALPKLESSPKASVAPGGWFSTVNGREPTTVRSYPRPSKPRWAVPAVALAGTLAGVLSVAIWRARPTSATPPSLSRSASGLVTHASAILPPPAPNERRAAPVAPEALPDAPPTPTPKASASSKPHRAPTRAPIRVTNFGGRR
jgi:serine/threonine-protein kinase